MKRLNRRAFLKAGIGVTSGLLPWSLAAVALPALNPTPGEIEGPFYPIIAVKDTDFDLTRINGKEGIAEGKIIFIKGRVLNTSKQPIEDARVDLWQANAGGRYFHPYDPNPAPLDPYFQGWAIIPSGSDGGFQFKTIFPGSYPASNAWERPPHIHYKISKPGYAELITQMYFPNQPLNDKDHFLRRKSEEERQLMIATLINKEPETYHFDIVLQKSL